MISIRRPLQRLLSTKVVWATALILLALTRWGHLRYRSYHNQVAYRSLEASQVNGGADTSPLYSGKPAAAELDSRTLWLVGRYLLYHNDPVQASGLLAQAGESLSDDYQVHRDLLYAYDGVGKFEEFVREYERGETIRHLLAKTIASDSQLPMRADVLSMGGFDPEDSASREVVLVNYVHSIDAALEEGDVETSVSGLVALKELFGADLLVLSRIDRACQAHWDPALCSGLSPDALRQFRQQPWEDVRLTGMIADAALHLHDRDLWTGTELLSLGRYLVWQHASEAKVADFLSAVSARGFGGDVWSDLAQELVWRRELAARTTTKQPAEAVAPLETNLLADPSTLFDDLEARYLSLGQQERRWYLEVHDTPPYGGASYVGGVDEYSCPNGEKALRVDGLWQDAVEDGPGAWAGFTSNPFDLAPGAEYEFSVRFRVEDSDSLPRVGVQFLPADAFGPVQQPQELFLVAGQWTFEQRLNVEGQSGVRARLQLAYRGHGPLWLCEPRLVLKVPPRDVAGPAPGEYQVRLSEPSLYCEDCGLVTDYQAHRDLLYAYDAAGASEEFVREYERGEAVRQSLRDLISSESEAVLQFLQEALALDDKLALRADRLSQGSFDLQNPGDRELVLVHYLRFIDASLEKGDAEAATSRLVFVRETFKRDPRDLLILPHVYRACQVGWEDAICADVSPGGLREYRLDTWGDARLTGLMGDVALRLYDQGLWTERELLSLGRYLVWQRALEPQTANFMSAVSERDLNTVVWSGLSEELVRRRQLAARSTTAQQGETGGPAGGLIEGNLLDDPSQWRLEVHDTPPYSGGSYVGGVDEYACPNGGKALRIDGLWRHAVKSGPDAWAGFTSNWFDLEAGADYELSSTVKVGHPRTNVYLEFLPAPLFGPAQKPQRLFPEEGKWHVMHQRLTSQGQSEVSAQVRVRYLGYGPIWVCEPHLLSKDYGDSGDATADPSGDYQVYLTVPTLICVDCEP